MAGLSLTHVWQALIIGSSVSICWGAAHAQTMTTTLEAKPMISTSVNVDYASSYIFRGQTVNRRATIQPAASLMVGEQAELGAWGNFPIEREREELEQEVDLYFRYTIPVGLANFVVGAIEYIYPEDDIDNDREIELAIGLDTILNPTLTAFFGVAGGVENSQYLQFDLSQDILEMNAVSVNLGGAMGYVRPEEGDEGLSYGLISLAANYAILSASANWLLETDEQINALSGQEDFYMTFGAGYTF
ncbi:MAG: TorF family putative porin [Oligoflexus sp.]